MKRYVIREGYSGTVIEQSDDLGEVLDIYKGYFDPSIDKSELDGWKDDLDEELTKLNQWGIDTEVNGVDLDEFLENCWETKDYYIEVVDIQFENDIKDKYDYYSNVKRMLKDFYGENVKITDKNIWDGKEAEVTESRYVVQNGLSGEVYLRTNDLAEAYKELVAYVYHNYNYYEEYENATELILKELRDFEIAYDRLSFDDEFDEYDRFYNFAEYLNDRPQLIDNLRELGIYVDVCSTYSNFSYLASISCDGDRISEDEESGEWSEIWYGISPKRINHFLAEHNIGRNELVNFELSDFIDKYYSGYEKGCDYRGQQHYYPVEYDYISIYDNKEDRCVFDGRDYLSLTSEMLNDYFGDLPIITKKELQDRINTIENDVDGFNTEIIDRKLKEMEEKAKLEIKYEEEQKKKETKRKSKGMSL